MNTTVPALSVAFMFISALGGFLIPIALFVWLRRRMKADVAPFFAGCAVMVLFAFVLESLFHRLVLSLPAGAVISGNTWLYALYGGLAAGVFEESGRFLAFRTVLRKYRGNDADALMYGAGHGGIEAVVLLSLGMISNIAVALMVNSGQADQITAPLSGDALKQMEDAFRTLSTTAPAVFLVGLGERVYAIALHLGLSVMVWFAAKEKRLLGLYPAAVLLHAALDFTAAALSGLGAPVGVIEAVEVVLAALTALLARAVWKRHHAVLPEEPADGGEENGL